MPDEDTWADTQRNSCDEDNNFLLAQLFVAS